MYWFTGSIPEAIGESRRKGLVFIVYIEGDNEDTQNMNTTWEDPKVAETLSKERCVAIKLDHKSEDCAQFSKLYPIVCVPATYFIGDRGLPLEVIGGSLPVDEFLTKSNKALETHLKTTTNNVTVQAAARSVPQTSEASSSTQQTSASNPPQEQPASPSSPEASSRDTVARPGPSDEPPRNVEQEMSVNERVERAKQLIEQKRLEKEEAEKQEAKKKESERRNQGQELIKAKREREERKAQDIVNQIKEDRAKEKAHREAVRQQIARDRAEREARRQNELQERQRAQAAEAAPSGAMAGSSERQGKSDCTSARLQFRLPDGSSVTNTFPADSPLETIRQYIITQLGPSTRSVTLYTTYPRRELTDEDLVKSLADLGLAPSSTLVVALKSSNAITPSGGSSFTELLLWILSPLFTLINFLKAFLFGSPDQPRGAHNPSSRRPDNTPQSQQPNSGVRRRGPGGGSTVKEQGGIHRLHNGDDEDNDNNTWNGNSTQQM
ncbi:hypothetical protein ACROYT_G025719 [Oculina patagonica]